VQQMRSLLACVGVLLCAAWVFGQGKPESQEGKNAATTADAGARIGGAGAGQAMTAARAKDEFKPDTAVVTLKGVCPGAAKGTAGKDCKAEVTRAEIDAVINTLEPKASSASRRQLAINYAKLVAAAGEAEKQHLEKDPEVARKLAVYERLVRMQVLADTMYRHMQEQAGNVPAADVEKYYAQHEADFEQGDVQRLMIPKLVESTSAEAQEFAVKRAKAEADALRERAVAGEDFDQLQQEAYRGLGIKGGVPGTTKLSATLRTRLPMEERSVFDLEAGQVTPVMDSPNAFVVLKLVTKQTIPLDTAQAGIRSTLQRERIQREMRKATESGMAEFNLRYFGLSTAPDLYPPPRVTSLPSDEGMAMDYAQRTQAARRAPVQRRREVTVFPKAQP
jgi:hypothetical protein